MAEQTQQEKLELIEEELKKKSLEMDEKEDNLIKREKKINSQLNIISKDELFLSITKYINDIFVIYEASLGTSEGCKELVTNLIEAKSKIDIQLVAMGPGKLM
jgi:hypothetical protein